MWVVTGEVWHAINISPPKYCISNTKAGEGGAGGSRTLVQTRNRCAFYMLIRLLVFEQDSGTGTQDPVLSSFFSPWHQGAATTSPKLRAPCAPAGIRHLHRQDVTLPDLVRD